MNSAVDRGIDLTGRHRSRRFVVVTLMAVCCLAIFFALDFLYSRMSRSAPAIARMAHPALHHTFGLISTATRCGGVASTASLPTVLALRTPLRETYALKSNTWRIVLIGDLFTEGIGTRFEDSFAGMLAVAGGQRSIKTEFLNAAVVSYSPTIYSQKNQIPSG